MDLALRGAASEHGAGSSTDHGLVIQTRILESVPTLRALMCPTNTLAL